jgi:hypothetical protein
MYGENGAIEDQMGYDFKTDREKPFPANLIANALKVQLQNGEASVASDKVHAHARTFSFAVWPLCMCTCYLFVQMHILNSICGRKGKDLELEPLKSSSHYDELNSMLHARFAVAGLRGAADRWLAGEKGPLLSHLSAIKAPGANLRKVAINLRGFNDEDTANEIMLAIVQPSLVELGFTRCKAIRVLPEAIGNCTSLTELNLEDCPDLTALPEAIGNCTSLTELYLNGCKGLTALPEAIGNCTSLTSLYLRRCTGLTALPEAIGNCTKLDLDDLRRRLPLL